MKIANIVGARPQFVKAAVIVRALEKFPGVQQVLIHTGQHYDCNMSDVFFDEFQLHADYNLGAGSGLPGAQTARMLESIERVLLDVKPDFGCDGGLFLRSTEKGEAYQVMIDYLEGGSVGGTYGEKLEGVKGDPAKDWAKYWKKDDWNNIRARIEGDVPHIQVWMNGNKLTDWTDTSNHLVGGATEGMIAVQVHRDSPDAKSHRWIPGGYHHFRNIAIKELP